MSSNKWKSGIFYGGDRIRYNESTHGELNNSRYYNRDTYHSHYTDYTETYKKSNQKQQCSHKDNEIKDKYGEKILSAACRSGNLELVKSLIEHGVNVNSKDKFEEPICKSGNLELVKYLIDHSANVNVKDKWGENILHFAKENCNKEIVDYLISNGAKE
jgi:ankyrin repeat protein